MRLETSKKPTKNKPAPSTENLERIIGKTVEIIPLILR